LKVSKFNKKVTFEVVTETQNSLGEPVESWATYAKSWANIHPIAGKEYFQAQQLQSELSARITIPYSKKISAINTQKYRITYSGKVYNILDDMNYDLENRELTFMCSVKNG